MKNLVALACLLCVVAAIPVPDSKPQSSLDLLQIPLAGNKELDILSLTDENGKITERNKRTIDILRQLFPTLTQIVEAKIQAVLPILIRQLGPLLLRGAAGGGGAGTTSSSNDDSDDDFDSEVEKNTGGRKAQTEEGAVDPNAINDELVQTIRRVREAAAVAEQQEKAKEQQAQDKKFDVKVELPSDQDGQASETENKSAPLDELSLDNDTDDENRDKRFLTFGASSGGSGGGSGNFLFDIVRNTADRVARAAGTVYRVVAGTESLDKAAPAAGSSASAGLQLANDTSSSTNTTTTNPDDDDDSLISGSSGTQDSDERANSADGAAAVHSSAEGYTEGIPGPVTRLVVLANRGLSNLIQDLILRIAQTSERVVNFKARLITSLI